MMIDGNEDVKELKGGMKARHETYALKHARMGELRGGAGSSSASWPPQPNLQSWDPTTQGSIDPSLHWPKISLMHGMKSKALKMGRAISKFFHDMSKTSFHVR